MTPDHAPEPSLSLSATWGTTPAERALPFPCDAFVPAPDAVLYRGVTVAAAAPVVFRWLCQMRVAPYSYDWIDNLGRRSPQQLIDGLDDLAVGQDVMRIFALAAFERDRHLTIRTKARGATHDLLGNSAATYLIIPDLTGGCRLLVKIALRYPPGLSGWLMRHFLPWGDLIMMRRQLLNLKRLAEATPRSQHVEL